MTFRIAWLVAVTWASASATFAPGRKYTRITPIPVYDWLSTCSMSFTDAVSTRSLIRTIRLSISSGGIPVYCQTIDTTGTSASGKMSVAIRLVLTAPNTAIKTARTMIVYVRRSASRTIHMFALSFRRYPNAAKRHCRDDGQRKDCAVVGCKFVEMRPPGRLSTARNAATPHAIGQSWIARPTLAGDSSCQSGEEVTTDSHRGWELEWPDRRTPSPERVGVGSAFCGPAVSRSRRPSRLRTAG
jgi:hypothetical protein